jgi:tetratricopeptide (TPR) repeat protein
MYNLFPLIIILASLAVIIFIIIRKFPALAILDVENMPEEKAAKIKEKIIGERLRRDWRHFEYRWRELLAVKETFGNAWKKWWKKLEARRQHYRQEKKLQSASPAVRIEHLLRQAKDFFKNADDKALAEAEKKLIEVIRLDAKNLTAFMELGKVYYQGRKFSEAKQTFLYALKLLELQDDKNKEAEVNFMLSDINKNLGNIDEARENVLESLKIEPNNPRYLDMLLELCIMKKDKDFARNIYTHLATVNPDNQKLAQWQEEIDKL